MKFDDNEILSNVIGRQLSSIFITYANLRHLTSIDVN